MLDRHDVAQVPNDIWVSTHSACGVSCPSSHAARQETIIKQRHVFVYRRYRLPNRHGISRAASLAQAASSAAPRGHLPTSGRLAMSSRGGPVPPPGPPPWLASTGVRPADIPRKPPPAVPWKRAPPRRSAASPVVVRVPVPVPVPVPVLVPAAPPEHKARPATPPAIPPKPAPSQPAAQRWP